MTRPPTLTLDLAVCPNCDAGFRATIRADGTIVFANLHVEDVDDLERAVLPRLLQSARVARAVATGHGT